VKFKVIDYPQRSREWFSARAGRLTGSQAKDMLAQIKTGEAAARRDLRCKLVVERLTGIPQEDGYVNADMQWGIDQEENAFAAYEAHTGIVARRTGFLCSDSLMVGCSLDGDVDGFTGIVELKCPKSATHLSYLREPRAPANHRAQILHNLWVTGAEWCDFVSYDPRFPEHLRLFVVRVPRVEIDILAYSKQAEVFLAEVDAEVEYVSQLAVA
jgi:hypothetical protein